jgi:FKBP-type peptidyl-prolyl cis-trans isomerase
MRCRPGLQLVSEVIGTGEPVTKGDRVTVRLNGWLNRGDSIQKDVQIEFTIGGREVIPGLEYSVEGMRTGGTRKVRISPHLGYGDVGVGDLIPPRAVIVYAIELLRIERAAPASPW